MINQIFWNSFNCIPQTGPQTFKRLIEGFSSMQEAWEASYQDFIACGVTTSVAKKIIEKRDDVNPEKEWYRLEQAGIKMTTIQHKEYPPLLKEIARPPAVLYWKGNWQAGAYSQGYPFTFKCCCRKTQQEGSAGNSRVIQAFMELKRMNFDLTHHVQVAKVSKPHGIKG